MTMDALVFDFDGLILDTEWSDFVSVGEVFAAHGVDLPVDEWRSDVGTIPDRHWTEWLEDVLGRPIDRVAVRASRIERYHALIAEESVLPGVIELIDQARAAGVALVVASSSSSPWVEPHLERLDLRDRFDVVVTRDQVDAVKPAPDLYLAAAAALGADPLRSVALEDSAHGCTAAVAAGLRCIAVPNRVTRTQDFGHADRVVASLADVELADLEALVDGPAGTRRSR